MRPEVWPVFLEVRPAMLSRARPHAMTMLLSLAVWASVGAQEPPIQFRLGAAGTEVRPGGTLVLTVTARIPRGWHLYGTRQVPGGPLPTTLQAGPDPPFALASPVTASAPRSEFDPNFGLLVEWYDDSAAFRVPLRAGRTALPGTYDARVLVSYQRCNDRICLPLTTDTLRAPVIIAGAPEPSDATLRPPLSTRPPRMPAGREMGADIVGSAPAAAAVEQAMRDPARGEDTGRAAPPALPGPGRAEAGASPSRPGPPPGAQVSLVARYLVLGTAIILLLVLLLLGLLALRRPGTPRR